MDDIGVGIFFGVIFGFVLGYGAYGVLDLERCEETLPRSQQCVLMVVPEVANDMPNMQER